MHTMASLSVLYKSLEKEHGKQGWWPVKGEYHLGDYSYPRDDKQRFEICVGAILTQNTTWKNVEKALEKLRREKLIDAKKMLGAEEEKLKSCIRPAGYFNQKARKLKEFSKFYLSLKNRKPCREELLSVWGIGRETADSILLYAYHEPVFVVDTYTRRLLIKEGLIFGKEDYDEIQELFRKGLKRDHALYNEFHALIVEWGKNN